MCEHLGRDEHSYVLASSDAAHTVDVVGTHVRLGSASAASAAMGVVAASGAAPVNTGAPALSGTAQAADVERDHRVVVEQPDVVFVSVAGLQLVGRGVCEHLGRDQHLVCAGIERCGTYG